MANHLLTQTLPRDVADLACYYTRGMEPGTEEDRTIRSLARQVAEGERDRSEALDELMRWHVGQGGAGRIEDRERLDTALNQAVFRLSKEGEGIAAEPRRDMHPLVAKGLGIDPDLPLTRDQLNHLLGGNRADGEKIEGKHYSKLKTFIDPKTGEEKEKVPLGSVDFCLTPDKSVSVAWAFATAAEQAAIYQAHRDAVHETMLYLEQKLGLAKLGDGGKDGAEPGHLGWVSFDHYTSRPTLWIARDEDGKRITDSVPVPVAGDPDLHTHTTVINAVFCESGRVGSLDLNRLDGLIKEGGALYQAHLAANLRRLGADVILDQDTGMARLPAIPTEVRDHFSKKTRNGEAAAKEYAKEHGLDWDSLPDARRVALLKAGTQGLVAGLDGETIGKLKKDDMADFASWRTQAETLGWEHRTVVAYGPPVPPIDRDERIRMAYEESQPWIEKDLNARAVITGPDARTAALRGLIAAGIENTSDVNRVTQLYRDEGVTQYGERTALAWGHDVGRDQLGITTSLHEQHEREFIAKAKAAAADKSDALTRREIKAAIAKTELTFNDAHGREQRKGIDQIGTGGRLGVLIGAAGMGKTTAMKPLVAAWHEQQRDVHGLALAWRQADDLVDAGIPQSRVKAYSVFMNAVKSGDITLSARSVLVVDELSLLGTRQGLEMVRLQAKTGCRMVWLGDDRQAQSIEAGPLIGLARKALGTEQVPEVLTTRRQQTDREREIVGLFREGKAADALAMKREDGTAELVPGSYNDTVKRAAALVRERLASGTQITVSTPTNADAHQLGVAIREARRELGQVERDLVTIKATDEAGNIYDMAIAAGDKLRLFRSTRAEGARGSIGRNGSVVTVLDADKDGVQVRNAKGNAGRITWKTLSDEQGRVRLAYGEAQTTHTAQGSTVAEHVYVLPAGSKAVTGFSAYSSGTRHERTSFLLISEGAEKSEVKRRRPLNDVRPISAEDTWSNVARNLSRQPEKTMALDFLARATDVQRGSVRRFQQGLMPSELNRRDGRPPTGLHETLKHKRAAETLAPLLAKLEQRTDRHRAMIDRVAGLGERLTQAVRHARERLQPSRAPTRERGQGPRMSV